MSESELHIDRAASNSMSVAPPTPDDQGRKDDAGNVPRDGDDADERLDRGLDESMDASDPPLIRIRAAAPIRRRPRAMTRKSKPAVSATLEPHRAAWGCRPAPPG